MEKLFLLLKQKLEVSSFSIHFYLPILNPVQFWAWYLNSIKSVLIIDMSSSESPGRSPEAEEKSKPHKVFVTNLSIEVIFA